MNISSVKKDMDALLPQIIEWRRHLHHNPELSFQEYETTEYIVSVLQSLEGVEISRPTPTGVVATIRGDKPGKKIAFRADIDALPIQENNDLPFASCRSGVMHACGHDGHTAMQLGLAVVASRHRAEMEGELVLIFQHAEETPPGGAVELFNAGVMEGVEELYGCHLSSNYPTGKLGIRSGALTAATDRFDITVLGKGGHSAMPESCIDPIVTGSQIVTALQGIVSRNVRALDAVVLSVCQVSAGDAYNIIPQTMTITGSVRTFSETNRARVEQRIREIASGICSAAGASCEVRYERGYSSVINDEHLTSQLENAVSAYLGSEVILPIEPVMPGEDFSALQKNCPACFVEIGTRDPSKGTDKPHHNPGYRMDEEGLKYGSGLLAAILCARL